MYLLGADNWRNATNIQPEIRRFLKWVLEFNDEERLLGWSSYDWQKVSPKDSMLLYGCLFSHYQAFAIACLFLWIQLPEYAIGARMTGGGLSMVDPGSFLNILRIFMINQGEKGWRKWKINDLFPSITNEEWIEIRQLTSPACVWGFLLRYVRWYYSRLSNKSPLVSG